MGIDAVKVKDLLVFIGQSWKYIPQWVRTDYEKGNIIFTCEGVRIFTLEGWMYGGVEDWIIRGVAGEVYPCKPDIFEATYEAVEE